MEAAEDAAAGREAEPGSVPLTAMDAASMEASAPAAPEDPGTSAPIFPGKPTPKGACKCLRLSATVEPVRAASRWRMDLRMLMAFVPMHQCHLGAIAGCIQAEHSMQLSDD